MVNDHITHSLPGFSQPEPASTSEHTHTHTLQSTYTFRHCWALILDSGVNTCSQKLVASFCKGNWKCKTQTSKRGTDIQSLYYLIQKPVLSKVTFDCVTCEKRVLALHDSSSEIFLANLKHILGDFARYTWLTSSPFSKLTLVIFKCDFFK